MADLLASVPEPADLYDYRGLPTTEDGAPLWLPHNQGDVFEGVEIPGIDDPTGEGLCMLFMHPCTMRAGAILRDKVTVLSVRRQQNRGLNRDMARWSKMFKVMPLPLLRNDNDIAYAADFMSVGTVSSTALGRATRRAVLSRTGRLVMQQRVIHHFSRYAPSLDVLEAATRAVETEIELQANWCEAACEVKGDETESTIRAAEESFDSYLSDKLELPTWAHDPESPAPIAGPTASRRDMLVGENQARVVTDVAGEILRRFAT
jgi:hypothetical protein